MERKKKILIVDSDLLACRALQKLFEKAGFEADCSLDGQESLEKANGSYDGVVIDPDGLPKVDGWEVITRLKNHDHLKKIPVIVVTLDYDYYKDKVKEIGADGLVNKFSPHRVLWKVAKILRTPKD